MEVVLRLYSWLCSGISSTGAQGPSVGNQTRVHARTVPKPLISSAQHDSSSWLVSSCRLQLLDVFLSSDFTRITKARFMALKYKPTIEWSLNSYSWSFSWMQSWTHLVFPVWGWKVSNLNKSRGWKESWELKKAGVEEPPETKNSGLHRFLLELSLFQGPHTRMISDHNGKQIYVSSIVL